MGEKVLAIISARAGSKAVPGKNLRLLNGRPLISYTIRAAKKSKEIDKVVVSTEDDKIAKTSKLYGAEIPFKRPEELAKDLVPLIAVTKHSMESMDNMGYKADIIVQLSPTCPFITSETLDESVKKIIETDCDSVVSLKRIEHEHPYRAKELFEGDRFRSFIKDIDVEKYQSRQELPDLYCTSGAVYTRKRHLLENWSGRDFCLGKVTRAIILDDIQAINIDRPIDFVFAEFLQKKADALKKEGLI